MDDSSREDTDEPIEEDYPSSPETQPPPGASAIAFATFVDPSTSGMPGIEPMAKLEPSLFHQSSIPAHCRIALMANPSQEGQYVWTFVPRAKGPGLEPTVWPRVVKILGVDYQTTQDEWDMYKCNPKYECYLPPSGSPIVVGRPKPPPSATAHDPRAKTPLKRAGSDVSSDANASPRKRQKTTGFQMESGDSDVEEVPPAQFKATRANLRRKKEKAGPQGRTRSSSFRMQGMADDLPSVLQNGFSAGSPSPSKPSSSKEKFGMETDPVQTKRSRHSWEQDPAIRSAKRPKTFQAAEEEAEMEYLRTGRARRTKPPASRQTRGSGPPKSKAKEKDFWQDVNFSQFQGVQFTVDQEADANGQSTVKEEEMPQQSSTEEASARRSPPIFVDSADEDEGEYEIPGNRGWDGWDSLQDSDDERERRLYESRKKMEELNKLERRGNEELRRREQEHAARMEELRRQERQRFENEKRRQEEERLRRQRAEEEEQRRKKAEKENRRREGPWGQSWHQTNAPWSETYRSTGPGRQGGVNFEWFNNFESNPFGSRGSSFQSYRPAATSSISNTWTSQKALDRYNRLSESFDAFKSTPSIPLPPEDQIPWPVLGPKYDLNQVNWKSVEKFFEEAERLMGGRGAGREKWKEFLKLSTRRFHPDRWRARGLIGDKGFGIDVEEVVNHVSKVLTPLYRNAN